MYCILECLGYEQPTHHTRHTVSYVFIRATNVMKKIVQAAFIANL